MAKDTIQEWTGEELTQCSLYGIRIYHEGAVLATHVDRMPLVSSAIINVAQVSYIYITLILLVRKKCLVRRCHRAFDTDTTDTLFWCNRMLTILGLWRSLDMMEGLKTLPWNQVIWSCTNHTASSMVGRFP
jgi:hypothetical protein